MSKRRSQRVQSGTSSRLVRTERVLRRGSPALRQALAAGELTLYRAGEIARLSDPDQQRIALETWSNAGRQKHLGQRIAAQVIDRYLTNQQAAVDLGQLSGLIQDAVVRHSPSLSRRDAGLKRSALC